MHVLQRAPCSPRGPVQRYALFLAGNGRLRVAACGLRAGTAADQGQRRPCRQVLPGPPTPPPAARSQKLVRRPCRGRQPRPKRVAPQLGSFPQLLLACWAPCRALRLLLSRLLSSASWLPCKALLQRPVLLEVLATWLLGRPLLRPPLKPRWPGLRRKAHKPGHWLALQRGQHWAATAGRAGSLLRLEGRPMPE